MMAFYGVYVPPKFEPSVVAAANINNDPEKNLFVFAKKEEAFKVLKTHSDARVKGFASRDEAAHFAQHGQDLVLTNATNTNTTANQSFNDSPSGKIQPQQPQLQQQQQMKSPSSALNPEKTAFRGPKIQELVEFRKCIESGNLTVVHAKIMENPRFLIGSGDTPAILKEGQRYNAMHVAALSKNAKMCELLLSTVKPSYVQMFHGGRQTREVSEEVASKLLDLYLNTPEKGRFETPLHLAVKYGAVEVVEVLTSYPQCRMLANKEEHMPKDIVCLRAPTMAQEVKDRIAQLLEERFYVPVLRSSDCTVPPVIGEPFSTRSPLMNLSGGGGSSGLMNSPLLTPELQIRAYAGPMEKEQAENFRKRWRTPPAVFNRSANGNSTFNGSGSSLLSLSLGAGGGGHLNTSGGGGGVENVLLMRSPIRSQPPSVQGNRQQMIQRLLLNFTSPGKSANNDNNYVSTPKGKSLRSIDEFFPDDNNDADHHRGSNESLSLHRMRVPGLGLEVSAKKALFGNNNNNTSGNSGSPLLLLRQPASMDNDNYDEVESSDLDSSYRERHLKLTDNEKGLEVVGRLLAKERNVGWSEYWAFLDNFANLTTPQGMAQLEQHFKGRQEQMERDKEQETQVTSKRNSLGGGGGGKDKEERLNISDICDRLNELHLNNSLKLKQASIENGENKSHSNNNDNHQNSDNSAQAALNAFLCVEKSCQVYARRAMKKIVAVTGGDSSATVAASLLNATLNGELTRLESLVCSYRDDPRFQRRIDFQVVHSRFAHLVLTYLVLEDERTYRALLPKLKRSLVAIRSAQVKARAEEEEGVDVQNGVPDKVESIEGHSALLIKSTSRHSRCLAKLLLTYAENEEEKIRLNGGGLGQLVAEEDCQRRWAEEAKCECVWVVPKGKVVANAAGQNVKNPHVLRMRDKNKKKRINDRIKRKIEAEANNNHNNHNNNQVSSGMWAYRSKLPSAENEDEDVVWADSNDSDRSVDSTDSDSECFFYTPVESPTEFLTASDRSDASEDDEGDDVDVDGVIVRRRRTKKLTRKQKRTKSGALVDLDSYRNYILGDEPTKTDMDVFNAICDVAVEEGAYPSIHKWQEAIRLHSMEEIQNFPSLSMIVRKSIPIRRASQGGPMAVDGSPTLSGRRLFGGLGSPMRM